MASSGRHNVFLVTEILETILLQTDIHALLTSAQRVCRKWRGLIKYSTDLQGALFFKPVKYSLPRGVPGIRNPLLADSIWPWFCARHANKWGAPPVEGGAKIPLLDFHDSERFFRKGASWKRMLFQQPPRSCIGLVEKDGKAVDGPAYTEFKVQPDGDYLRIGDMVRPCSEMFCVRIHPLPEEGLLWFGMMHTPEDVKRKPLLLRGWLLTDAQHGEIPQSQVVYATSKYLRDCDVVFFTLECGRARGQYVGEYDYNNTAVQLDKWLRDMRRSLVPGHISIPMLAS